MFRVRSRSNRTNSHYANFWRGLRRVALSKAIGKTRFVEALEGRVLLASVAWDGGGDHLSWGDPLNWSGDVLPAADDDVTISADSSPTVAITTTVNVHSITGNAALRIDAGQLAITSLAADSLSIVNSGVLAAPAMTQLQVTVADDLGIDAGSAITADGQGYSVGNGPGAISASDPLEQVGTERQAENEQMFAASPGGAGGLECGCYPSGRARRGGCRRPDDSRLIAAESGTSTDLRAPAAR